MTVARKRVAEALPAYDVGEQLGQGRFGTVFAVRHRRLGRPAAVKVIALADDVTREEHRRFVTEAQILGALDHPHIVRIFDYHEQDNLALLVMERMAGTLRERMRRGPLPVPAACAVGLAVASALDYAHQEGVLHRDIKPDNMLFSAGNVLKVADFGIAKIAEGSAFLGSTLMGTPLYMAPEQLDGDTLGFGTDVYSLGVVLHELLAGRPPVERGLALGQLLQARRQGSPPPPDGVAPGLAAVVQRSLQGPRTERYPTAKAFALDLAAAATAELERDWFAQSKLWVRTTLDDDVRETVARGERPSADPPEQPDNEPAGAVADRAKPAGSGNQPAGSDNQAVDSAPPRTGPSTAGRRSIWRGRRREQPSQQGRSSGLRHVTERPPPTGGSAGTRALPFIRDDGAKMDYPYALAAGGDGSVYVARPARHLISVIRPDGQVGTVAGTGKSGGSGDGGPAVRAEVDAPCGLAFDPAGRLCLVENLSGRLRRIDPDGMVELLAGAPGARAVGSGAGQPIPGEVPRGQQYPSGQGLREHGSFAPPEALVPQYPSGALRGPRGIAVTRDGTVYIADTDGHCIVRMVGAGELAVVAGTGEPGFAGDGGPAVEAELNRPHALAADGEGTLYIADTGNRRVRSVTPDGQIRSVTGTYLSGPIEPGMPADQAPIGRPFGVACDPSGGFYIADPDLHRVWLVTVAAGITVAAGTGRSGRPLKGRSAAATDLVRPQALATAADGTLYIGDVGSHAIWRLAPSDPTSMVLHSR
ncbi:MAG: serine/threonine-protein kinase [Frankia sp.]